MITPDMVKACYRVLLNREPESEEAVMGKAELPDFEALLLDFVSSPEYQTKVPELTRIIDAIYDGADRNIDYEVSAEQLAACFMRVRREWTLLGEREPYWSVITGEAFKSSNLDDKALDTFFTSGRRTVSHLKNCLSRTGRELAKGHCLEFGCGTGRVTRYLAELFDFVTGIDVSPAHLKLAGENIRHAGIANVSFKLLESPEQLSSTPECDFLFSTLVLQHNPPPLQNFTLDKLFARIRPGGSAFIQIPTHTPGYVFKIEQYLSTPSPGMEMHSLPMQVVFERLDQHNMVPVEVLMDDMTGMLGSHTFFAIKRARPQTETTIWYKLQAVLFGSGKR